MTNVGRPVAASREAKRRAVLGVLSDWLSRSQPKLLAGTLSQFCTSATMLAVVPNGAAPRPATTCVPLIVAEKSRGDAAPAMLQGVDGAKRSFQEIGRASCR